MGCFLISGFRRIFSLFMAVWQTASDRNVGLISAGLAFFGMFSIFPGLAAIIALFGLLAALVVVVGQLELMQEIIPQQAYKIIHDQIMRLLNARSETLGMTTIISILVALWSAQAGVAGLMGGLNVIANRWLRAFLKGVVVALTLTVVLVLLAMMAMAAVVIAPIVLSFLPLSMGSAVALELLRWLLALVVLFFGLSILYRFGPNLRGASIRWITIGAFLVIVCWLAASTGLSYYFANFASYNEVYGSISAVIAMLLLLYIAAYLILLGAALNLHVHGSVVGAWEDA